MDSVSTPPGQVADWHYIGHYGQLGPLTLGQMEELILDGVIDADTYVWQTGMPDWRRAAEVPRLTAVLQRLAPAPAPPEFRPPAAPPPLPSAPPAASPAFDLTGLMPGLSSAPSAPGPYPAPYGGALPASAYSGAVPAHLAHWADGPVSDKSRVLAGLLQLIVPGVGRMYLGYAAQGVMQLLLTPFGCLVGWLWSIVDGLVMLAGGVQHDGYGRRLRG